MPVSKKFSRAKTALLFVVTVGGGAATFKYLSDATKAQWQETRQRAGILDKAEKTGAFNTTEETPVSDCVNRGYAPDACAAAYESANDLAARYINSDIAPPVVAVQFKLDDPKIALALRGGHLSQRPAKPGHAVRQDNKEIDTRPARPIITGLSGQQTPSP
ncbi:MAG: hypothetical protein WDO70_06820 [Alphaproteobacteria bacterium]